MDPALSVLVYLPVGWRQIKLIKFDTCSGVWGRLGSTHSWLAYFVGRGRRGVLAFGFGVYVVG